MTIKDQQLISEHLSNERTFLAWIRTGVGIMAFGFVVVKFSLFMGTAMPQSNHDQVQSSIESQAIGIFLVTGGAFATMVGYVRYRRTANLMRKGTFKYTTTFLTILALVVLVTSILLIAYLASTAGSTVQKIPVAGMLA